MKLMLLAIAALTSSLSLAAAPSKGHLDELLRSNAVVIVVDSSTEGTRSSSQTLSMYEHGRLTLRTKVSTGKPKEDLRSWRATPRGEFRVVSQTPHFVSPAFVGLEHYNDTMTSGVFSIFGCHDWTRSRCNGEGPASVSSRRGVRSTRRGIRMSLEESARLYKAIQFNFRSTVVLVHD